MQFELPVLLYIHHPYRVVISVRCCGMSRKSCNGKEVRGQSIAFLLEGLVNYRRYGERPASY